MTMTRTMMMALAMAALAVPVVAQTVQDGNSVPGGNAVVPLTLKNGRVGKVQAYVQVDRTGFAIDGRESFQMVTANTPSAPVTVYGGDYILSQTCTGYGTLSVQVLGPDGETYQTILTKTSSDTAGGTGIGLGSYARLRVAVTGTTGCAALLARVPA